MARDMSATLTVHKDRKLGVTVDRYNDRGGRVLSYRVLGSARKALYEETHGRSIMPGDWTDTGGYGAERALSSRGF